MYTTLIIALFSILGPSRPLRPKCANRPGLSFPDRPICDDIHEKCQMDTI